MHRSNGLRRSPVDSKGKAFRYAWIAVLAMLLSQIMSGPALAQDRDAQTVWRLLDYIAVDYAGAVSDGRVSSEAEYAEMTEFAGQVETRLTALPENAGKAELLGRSRTLRTIIARKASPNEVAAQSRALASALLAAYPVPLAPTAPPDLARGAALYSQNCVSCHGATGDGHGPGSIGLKPPPIAFTDQTRARQRSLFGLYQVITQGLDGTAMASFDSLSDEDRWALAFYVGGFAYPTAEATQGERLWRDDASLRQRYPNLAAFVGTTPVAAAADMGDENANALIAYLRRHPDAIASHPDGSLRLTRERLDASLKAYAAGDRNAAADLALSAYLDGFEPVEPVLAARDPELMTRIEQAMGALRAAISRSRPLAEVQAANQQLAGLFSEAEAALAPEKASSASSFLGAFGVLLREGLEALLIVVAMIAFLRKTERTEVLGFVHGGWASALAAGVATWFVATYFIGISGASRELTEGFGSLFAAIILVTVGIWMHGKSNAESWQRYIKESIGCGTGSLLLRIGRATPSARLIGIDPDPAVMARARARFAVAGLSVELHVGFARQVAELVGDKRPTKIVSSLVFHQVPMEEKEAALASIFRSLETGGELHIADYGLQRTRLMRTLFGSIIQNLDGRANTEPNARGVLPDLMAAAGFRNVEETDVIATLSGSISLYRAAR